MKGNITRGLKSIKWSQDSLMQTQRLFLSFAAKEKLTFCNLRPISAEAFLLLEGNSKFQMIFWPHFVLLVTVLTGICSLALFTLQPKIPDCIWIDKNGFHEVWTCFPNRIQTHVWTWFRLHSNPIFTYVTSVQTRLPVWSDIGGPVASLRPQTTADVNKMATRWNPQ